jgi:outer membrane lipoprotein SlyB
MKYIGVKMENSKENVSDGNGSGSESGEAREKQKVVFIRETVYRGKKETLRSRILRRSVVGGTAGAAAGGVASALIGTMQGAATSGAFTIPTNGTQELGNAAVGQELSVDGLKLEIMKVSSNNVTIESTGKNGLTSVFKVPINQQTASTARDLMLTVHNGVVTAATELNPSNGITMAMGHGSTQFIILIANAYSFPSNGVSGVSLTSNLFTSTLGDPITSVLSYIPRGEPLLEYLIGGAIAIGLIVGAVSALFRMGRWKEKPDEKEIIRKEL